jgi:FkbM family methyltransferase
MTMQNILASGTLNYIWSHPNNQDGQWQAVGNFFRWQLQKRLKQQPLFHEFLPGLKLVCYPDSRSASAAVYCGLYDYDDMHFLLRFLRAEDSFLDIGANVGIYTLLAASKVSRGSIHSFEALPQNYQRLQENLKLNGFEQVQTYQIAISDRPGQAQLNLAEGDSKPFIGHETRENQITVPTDTLDHLLASKVDHNLTLGKIDIEGAELLAFKGATELLQQQLPKVWILEITDGVRHFGYGKEELVDFLAGFGYGLYGYCAASNELRPLQLEDQQGKNVLAIAEDALGLVRERLSTAIGSAKL